jgi:p38 MAP kinase
VVLPGSTGSTNSTKIHVIPTDVHQFSIITELLGTPPDDVIATIASENTLRFVQSLPKRQRVPFSQKFKTTDETGELASSFLSFRFGPKLSVVALDLLDKMLVFDPRKRITATEALAHEYVAPYHDPSDEPEAKEQFDWSFNDADLPVDTWKVMMYSEILGAPLARSSVVLVGADIPVYSDFHQIGDDGDAMAGDGTVPLTNGHDIPQGALAPAPAAAAAH